MYVNAPGFKGGDRTTIELPEVQKRMVKALKEAGKRVILVNFSGSAMAFADETENCEAIVQAWYPGQEGGAAVADVLYGDYNPSAKLPLTFYADDSEGPIKTLRGFKRVSLKAGEEAAVVRIPIDEETFLWWNPMTGRMNPMAGEYTLHHGDTSDDAQFKSVKYSYTNN